jgi:NHLM bacteriocin system secretion protein
MGGELTIVDQQIAALQGNSDQQYTVVSPFNGQVMQVKVEQGSFVTPGKTLLDLERSDENGTDLQAVIFLPVHQGKSVSPGMKVEVSPDSVSREQSGFMLGTVVSVSQYPVPYDELLRLMGNEEMVKQISNQEALTEVRIALIPNENGSGSYQWSSGEGPDVKINSRDLCAASIITRQQRPLDLFLPW